MSYELFTDGGVIKVNPSPYGGTFAWCLLRNGVLIREEAHVFLPQEIGTETVSNNNSELVAILSGIYEARGISGLSQIKLYSDSRIALGWVFDGYKTDSIPPFLLEKLQSSQKSGLTKCIQRTLLQGHPTKAELATGQGVRRNLPVHERNVQCDFACARVARAWWLANRPEGETQ